MATTTILDSTGTPVTVQLPLAPGRAAAAASRPVALSNEDAAFLDGIEAALTALLTGTILAAGSAVIGKVDHTTGSNGDGHKEVATPGTRVALAASTACKWVIIQAHRSNTSIVAVGGGTVVASATIGTASGATLAAGQSMTLQCDNLADISIDALVAGEGVVFTYGAA